MISDEKYLCVASVMGAHSLNGRLKIYVVSDNLQRFNKGNYLFLKVKDSFVKHKVIEFSIQKAKVGLLKLQGIDDRDHSEALKGVEIFITKDDAEKSKHELDDESFYYYDLLDCDVYIDDVKFGVVKEIVEAGGGEILSILDNKGKEKMVPFVKEMVNIDRIKEKRLDIYPPEGLFDY